MTVPEVPPAGENATTTPTNVASTAIPSTTTAAPPSVATAAPPSAATAAPTVAATAAPTIAATAAPIVAATAAPTADGNEQNRQIAGKDVVSVLTFLGVVNGYRVTTNTGKTHFR